MENDCHPMSRNMTFHHQVGFARQYFTCHPLSNVVFSIFFYNEGSVQTARPLKRVVESAWSENDSPLNQAPNFQSSFSAYRLSPAMLLQSTSSDIQSLEGKRTCKSLSGPLSNHLRLHINALKLSLCGKILSWLLICAAFHLTRCCAVFGSTAISHLFERKTRHRRGCSATHESLHHQFTERRPGCTGFVRAFRIVLMGARIGHIDDLGSVRMVALSSVSPASIFVEFVR